RHVQLQHHDGDEDREHPVAERLQPPFVRWTQRAPFRSITTWVARAVATCSTTLNPSLTRSRSRSRFSPRPRITGETARCSSSTSPAARKARTTDAPPL